MPFSRSALQPLTEELSRAADQGLSLPFWWRDDDAVHPSSKLERLIALTDRFGIRPLLAVIPAKASPSLADWLAEANADAAQHGYAHANHAAAGNKSCEFPDRLSTEEARNLLHAGRRRMDALFGRAWLPIFVPPWNRFAERHCALLPACGFKVYSGFGDAPTLPDGVQAANVHIDIMQWRPERRFLGAEACLAALAREVARRRQASSSQNGTMAAPLGLMTHHLVHDEEAWGFLERLAEYLSGMPAVRWRSAVNFVS